VNVGRSSAVMLLLNLCKKIARKKKHKIKIVIDKVVPILVRQTTLDGWAHDSKEILSKDPCLEMNRLAYRRM